MEQRKECNSCIPKYFGKKYCSQMSVFQGTIDELKAQLKAKEEKCTTLTEANHRLYHELSCEKEKNLTLDQKLDGERKAAQIVSKDVQKYVDFAKNLEVKHKILYFRIE